MSINREEIYFESIEDAIEKISMIFYRIDKLAASAILITEATDGEFQDPLYKQECVYYQLEAISDAAKRYEELTNKFDLTLPLTGKAAREGEQPCI